MSEYFDCVKEYKNIYNYAIQAEEALETADSVYRLDTFFNELRKAEEAILNKLIKEYSVQTEESLNLFGKIDLLHELDIIDEDSKNNFHAMRKGGNEGSHAGETMDTRSERNYFQEQKKRAEYLFKCLYVECCNFANEYMPNAKNKNTLNNFGSASNNVTIENVVSGNNSGNAGVKQGGVKQSQKSSVTHGSAQNSSAFTVSKQNGKFRTFNVIWNIGFLLIVGTTIVAIVNYVENDYSIPMSMYGGPYYIGLVLLFLGWLGLLGAKQITFYNGMLRFGEYTLSVETRGNKMDMKKSSFTINGQDIIRINKNTDFKNKMHTRKDGTNALSVVKHDTKDGFIIQIYYFLQDYCPRFDIIINDQLVVEGEKINLDNLRKAEESRVNYISDPQIKEKWMNA